MSRSVSVCSSFCFTAAFRASASIADALLTRLNRSRVEEGVSDDGDGDRDADVDVRDLLFDAGVTADACACGCT